MSRVLALLLVPLFTAVPALHAQLASPDLDRVRTLYLQAVHDPQAVERAIQAVADATHRAADPPDTVRSAVLTAYRGALITLRAKHGLWPPARLRHLREGLAILDAVVAANPNIAEVRYLRLMSCYYLPGVLRRPSSVREDFRALATLLPGVRTSYPDRLYLSIVRFVLENGALSPEQRHQLTATLGSANG